MVTVNYTGKLINGTEFDSSAKHGQPLKRPANTLVRGWTEALQMMKAGAKWEIYLPSSLAYGDRGSGPLIEPGSTLVFEMELVSFEAPPQAAVAQPGQPLTSDIIKVPSADELKKGAKIEVIKAERDGLAVEDMIALYAKSGWESISEADVQRLKWYGLFLRNPTPGFFMIRVRIPGGKTGSYQLRALADIAGTYGNGVLDLTTRQQIQLRQIRIEDVPAVFARMDEVGLTSLQTGMDNVRGVMSLTLPPTCDWSLKNTGASTWPPACSVNVRLLMLSQVPPCVVLSPRAVIWSMA